MRKDRLSSLSWAKSTVESKLQSLPQGDRQMGLRARRWLLENNFAYAAFHRHLGERLQQGGSLALPPSALLECYLESALWPHLYPTPEMCESHMIAPEGWADPFQKSRSAAADNSSGSGKYDSLKAAFVRKVLSPVLDFGKDYSLLQFQFDRYILRNTMHQAVLAKTNERKASLAMKARHWAPEYWKSHHRVLLDVVRMHGYPHLFLT
eukprot:1029878-Pyramimonas_sp.AAC.1